MNNWTPVATLPALETPVLVTDGQQILVGQLVTCFNTVSWEACGIDGYEWEWDFDARPLVSPITHWMSLPPLPQAF